MSETDSQGVYLQAPSGRQPTARAAMRDVQAKLTVRQPGQIRLQFAYPADEGPVAVEFRLNGRYWATLPAAPVAGDIFSREVACDVPPHDIAAEMRMECLLAGTEQELLAQHVFFADPASNPQGLLAADVYDAESNALFSVPWLEFDGANVTVSGAHLPPGGDPHRLSVEFADGVAGSFEYPLPSPEFGAHYWYWPNAHFSGFRVRINLPASRADADAFSFRFVTTPAGQAPDPDHDRVSKLSGWGDRGRIWIPSDLRACQEFPADEGQLSRVQTWSNQRTVAFTGYNAFKTFESLAARHGVGCRDGIRVMDWGCGHGRVGRHFIANWPNAHVIGVDIDPENIQWCQDHLTKGEFQLAPLWPPLDIPSDSLDLVFGLSVMTHLTADAQRAWISEIQRVLKPGGLALITFGGAAAAAFASIHHSPDWWVHWTETGFDDSLADPALTGKIQDPDYYRVTHQTAQQARAAWCRVMTVVDIEPQAFGYQDVAILRA